MNNFGKVLFFVIQKTLFFYSFFEGFSEFLRFCPGSEERFLSFFPSFRKSPIGFVGARLTIPVTLPPTTAGNLIRLFAQTPVQYVGDKKIYTEFSTSIFPRFFIGSPFCLRRRHIKKRKNSDFTRLAAVCKGLPTPPLYQRAKKPKKRGLLLGGSVFGFEG